MPDLVPVVEGHWLRVLRSDPVIDFGFCDGLACLTSCILVSAAWRLFLKNDIRSKFARSK